MKPLGIGIRSLAAVARDPRRPTSERERCLGLGAECTKASPAASGRRKMSLDIPSYRTSVWPTNRPQSRQPIADKAVFGNSRAYCQLTLLACGHAPPQFV